ncbi:MAG: tetratricopeptide repeat protein [Pseudanabaenaceae cyanobacterium]
MVSLQKAIQLKPSYANAHYTLGVAQAQLGQTQQAIASFIRAQAYFRQQQEHTWAQASQAQIQRLQQQHK